MPWLAPPSPISVLIEVSSRSAAAGSVGVTSRPPSGVPASLTTIATSPIQPRAASRPPARPSAWSSCPSSSENAGSALYRSSVWRIVAPKSLLTEATMAVEGMCSISDDLRFSVEPIDRSGLGAVASMTSASFFEADPVGAPGGDRLEQRFGHHGLGQARGLGRRRLLEVERPVDQRADGDVDEADMVAVGRVQGGRRTGFVGEVAAALGVDRGLDRDHVAGDGDLVVDDGDGQA